MFTIDTENNITAVAAGFEATSETHCFSSIEELAGLAANWPTSRLIEIWNSIPGLEPVKKFTSRSVAIGRIWRAIQSLASAAAPHAVEPEKGADEMKRTKKTAKAKAAAKPTKPVETREGSKTADVIEMLKRKKGATLEDIMKKTGWQSHTVRGFVAGTLKKKLGLEVESFKSESKERSYRIAS